jgi:hypothetical protein
MVLLGILNGLEPEPKLGFAAPWSQSRNKCFRLRIADNLYFRFKGVAAFCRLIRNLILHCYGTCTPVPVLPLSTSTPTLQPLTSGGPFLDG